MKRYIIIFFTVIPILITSPSVSAYSARSMVLIEKSGLEIIDSVNCNTRLPMASTTKIMTALVVLENADLDVNVKIPSSAVGVEGSSMYLTANEVLSVRDLLYGLMLTSGNDAASALAYFVGGGDETRFVDMMNKKATELGLTNTHFTNPSGLPDDNHYTTAFELAVITAKALDNPTFAEIVSTQNIKLSDGRTLSNHNKLLYLYDCAVGVKTGFTKKAGRCLVGAATKDGVTLICVTLNDGDDWNDHINAFEYGFTKKQSITFVKAGELSVTLNTPDGTAVKAVNRSTLTAVTNVGAEVTSVIKADKFVYAPKKAGDTVGTVTYFVEGREISDELYITENIDAPVKKDLLITRIINGIRELFKRKNK